MNAKTLNDLIEKMGLVRHDLVTLVKVTPRAVSMWCAGDREISGPVISYLKLLTSLPPALLAEELSILKGKKKMYDGMHYVEYTRATGTGIGSLVLMSGIVFGHDEGGVKYDGVYQPSSESIQSVDLKLRLTVPKGVQLVQGVPAQPVEYNFDIEVTVNQLGESPVVVQTPFGHVKAKFTHARALPEELVA